MASITYSSAAVRRRIFGTTGGTSTGSMNTQCWKHRPHVANLRGGLFLRDEPARLHAAHKARETHIFGARQAKCLGGSASFHPQGRPSRREALGLVGSSLGLSTLAVSAESRQESVSTEKEFKASSVDEGRPKASKSEFVPPPTRITAPGRIIAIGDLHGDLMKTLKVLELCKLIAPPEKGKQPRWIGGDTVLVQMGDILDRGDDEIGILRLLWQLGDEAKEEGGAVYILNGNHETLNVNGDFRYVTPAAFRESAMVGLNTADFTSGMYVETDQSLKGKTADFSSPGVSFTMQVRARLTLFSPGGPIARKLAQNPTVLIVNDTVFAHGGLLPSHVEYGLEEINAQVSQWMLGGPEPPQSAAFTPDSIVWNRLYSRDYQYPSDVLFACNTLEATLKMLGANRLVVGHTPQMDGCNASCGKKVWRVDVGMSSGVLDQEVQALEILPKPAQRHDVDGTSTSDGDDDDSVIVNVIKPYDTDWGY
uniref:Calcineurin-like phosphoesterase domain-containing protein n=1 Tax=Pyramimonas obovata TaxID=1411642 RepID=A0A7S0WLG4_9CHLO|mmetsp:Transcript_29685/g.64823  ORF Transcript_29685/g.64823 Transcript_29685/m.64823 type:complete len:480 (+) Transcript_29685:85-1524(+)|eukprot:CAMPEP_0118935970 /NCGR_PEP_ID=MMETSP1169-20130426/15927_1 /TAXON_ID=36882 /ORGANISM="Pyramimonas obovata, Strain CCMP722" /LENGTH=479 /DNA_ID=CAMNT_0006879053 /DNA_START=61 /DNA_END=1500 /DNA_ORIENTATION=-